MLKKIELKKFRRHEAFVVNCRERNIFVGANNAGKSTILDALRIFGDVQRFAERRVPQLRSIDGLDIGAAYELSNSNFSVTIDNIATNYSDEYSEIIITHANGSKLYVRINPNLSPSVFIITDKKLTKTKDFFSRCFPEKIVVVPTLSQFEDSEKPNDPAYVRSVEYTRLAARNFRNTWYLKSPDEFEDLRNLVCANWVDIDIAKAELNGNFPPKLQMFYSEKKIPREIFWSGFGFQAWLQMMTHILRGRPEDILVLDEPDIYLHADLQRRLFHTAKQRFAQIFIATHSSEIMNEANANDVVLVRPGYARGSRITSEAGYRSAHALLGSSENADFARLSRAKRIIAFEGNDRSIYRRLEQIRRKAGVFSDPDTLSIKIGGYEHWQRVGNLSWLFKEVFGLEARIFALFDRDYRCDQQILEFEERLRDMGILCHVLKRKEIENYLLEVGPLTEAIKRVGNKRGLDINSEEIGELLWTTAQKQHDDCLINTQSFATKYFAHKRDPRDQATIMKTAKIEFDKDWSRTQFSKRVSGKQYIVDLNDSLRSIYGINISTSSLIDEFSSKDLDPEMAEVIDLANKELGA